MILNQILKALLSFGIRLLYFYVFLHFIKLIPTCHIVCDSYERKRKVLQIFQ